MDAVILILAGIYFLMVGIEGNAQNFFAELAQEEEFIYWIIAILVVTALWETPVGARVAKPMALLIVLGFLLSKNASTGQANYQMIASGLKNIAPAL